jgi:hypothetical protein
VPDGRELRRCSRVGTCRFSPEFECKGLSITECHIFARFPLKLTKSAPGIARELAK